ncbi:MAG: DUF523 domain-containing protein [Desulfobacterales bacterium]|uniref:DUF523 domain-containing protein n=1 Tax=Candidatus Desulfatibia vada TaxID=2841696 RepID=A0A8J6TM96_9BACT|nr:DUF523 domain-containing protein [Candidatus Desulfatibia vada]
MNGQKKSRAKILVSACLVGERVRYDGMALVCKDRILEYWQQEDRVLAFCPEVAAGLAVPRSPAEIIGEGDGTAVLQGLAKVINRDGKEMTEQFVIGARKALEQVMAQSIALAVLKDGSPSCGSSYIYDGSFTGVSEAGKGVTAALFEENGIRVFNEHQMAEAAAYLTRRVRNAARV